MGSFASKIYRGMMLLACISMLAAFAAIMLATPPVKTVLGGAKGMGLIPVLGQTGKAQLGFGVLLSIGLIASTYI